MIKISSDPSFALNAHNNCIVKRSKVIGVNFIELFKYKSFREDRAKFERYIEALRKILLNIENEFPGYMIEFIPLYKSDIEFFANYFARDFPRIEVMEVNTYQDLVRHLYKYSFVIATRFHAIVFAIMTTTPVFGLVYHHKSLSVVEKYGVDYDIISDGSLPPLKDKDIDVERIKKSLQKLRSM